RRFHGGRSRGPRHRPQIAHSLAPTLPGRVLVSSSLAVLLLSLSHLVHEACDPAVSLTDRAIRLPALAAVADILRARGPKSFPDRLEMGDEALEPDSLGVKSCWLVFEGCQGLDDGIHCSTNGLNFIHAIKGCPSLIGDDLARLVQGKGQDGHFLLGPH